LKMTTRLSFLLLILVLFVVMLAGTQHAFSRSVNDGRQNEAGEILRLYYQLSALPIKETKAWFRNASPNNKSYLWRTHLALFLVTHPELHERQKKVVLAAMSFATPEFFEMRPTDPGWKEKVSDPLRSLEVQVISAFSRNDAAKIFATLNDDIEALNGSTACAGSISLRNIDSKQLADSSASIQWINIGFGGQDKDKATGKDSKEKGTDKEKGKDKAPDRDKQEGGLRACECSTDSDWCPIWGYCKGTNCSPTQSGCGTFWAYPCNGASCR
jgi:hypothetical protein